MKCVVFRNEDYTEPDDNFATYGGLIPLEPYHLKPADFDDPAEHGTKWTKDLEDWLRPDEFPSPCCSDAKAEYFLGDWEDGWCTFQCEKCGRYIDFERRDYITNAAVIKVPREAPEAD